MNSRHPAFSAPALAVLAALALPSAAAAQEALPLLPGVAPVTRELEDGAVHAYALELGEGYFVSGAADQQSVDVVVRVVSPDGAEVRAFDGSARGPDPFQFTTREAGTYRVEVTPLQGARGGYALSLARAEPLAPTPEGRLDQRMSAYDGPRSPGAVVGVVRGGELVHVRGYGMANLEYGVPNDAGTVYHVASVSKQFAAFAVALLAQQGRLSLDDDVRQHLPDLPDFGTPITLRHLVHHTSGLRDQWTLWSMAGGRMDDVITQESLLALVRRQRELNFAPGSEHLYSNTGYSLLAEVVEKVTGEEYGAWMRTAIFEPLGMTQTQVYDDHERIVPGRAYSYRADPEGGHRKAVLSYANQGATSLFTTAGDLARWLGNFHTGRVGGPALIRQMQERAVLADGDTLAYAFGIAVGEHRGLRMLQHGGADAGYRAMLAYYPEIDAGVVVLANLASFDAGATAREVAEDFFGEHMQPAEEEPAPAPAPAASGAVAVAPALLERYAGRFQAENGPTVTFTRRGDALFTRAEGQRELPLTPLSDSVFRLGSGEARVTFHREADGSVRRATAWQGREVALRRAEPWAPSAAELGAYAGRYYSPELETFYTVAVEDGALVARHRRHGAIPLSPAEPDAFRAGEWFLGTLRFERGAEGRVTGMRATSGRVRNLWFERQE